MLKNLSNGSSMPPPALSCPSDRSHPVILTLTHSGILSMAVYLVPLSDNMLAAEVSGTGSEPRKPALVNMHQVLTRWF